MDETRATPSRWDEDRKRRLDPAEQRKRPRRTLDQWRDLVSEIIEEAVERGEFDNLPGRGKPQNLQPNPNEPPELALAHKLLKDNDLPPAWILDRKEILAEIEALRQEMRRVWEWTAHCLAQEDADVEALQHSWNYDLQRWEIQIRQLNGRILDLNLSQPFWYLELMRLRLDDELRRIGARRELAPSSPSGR